MEILRLRPRIRPEIPVVGGRGIATRDDAERLAANGVQAMLHGQSLMTADGISAAVCRLIG